MKWEMEILTPTSYPLYSNWLFEDNKSTKWTPAENKAFENALAVFDKDTPDRWQRVAAMVPGKTVMDVIRQYRELEDDVSNIEAGLVPIPGYSTSSFTLEWGSTSSHCYDDDVAAALKHSYGTTGGKRSSSSSSSSSTRSSDQERKKGVPWTEEEHKLFLLGLKKYGKGDWRNISRKFVITRTPTQVASHAQKYFIRQLSGGKDKRRASIHDITTVNLNDTQIPSPDNNRKPPVSVSSSPEENSTTHKMPFQWNHHHHHHQQQQQQTTSSNNSIMDFNMEQAAGNNMFTVYSNGVNSYNELTIQDQKQQLLLHRDGDSAAIHEPYLGCQTMAFQMQSPHQHPYA